MSLVKAGPIRNCGTANVITCLRRRKKKKLPCRCNCRGRICKSGGRICERNRPTDTKARGEGIRGCASGAGAEISLQPIVQMMVKQLCPCSPWRTSGMEKSTCSPGGNQSG